MTYEEVRDLDKCVTATRSGKRQWKRITTEEQDVEVYSSPSGEKDYSVVFRRKKGYRHHNNSLRIVNKDGHIIGWPQTLPDEGSCLDELYYAIQGQMLREQLRRKQTEGESK